MGFVARINLLNFFLGSFLVLSLKAGADEAPQVDLQALNELASSTPWLNALHYRRHGFGFGPFMSQADGEAFFLSPEGRRDPLQELLATIEAFKMPGVKNYGHRQLSAACAFPWRYHFIKSHLDIELPQISCPELDSFLAQFQADRVSVVFSTAFPNNPASMFGHSFLLFHQKEPEGRKNMDLLNMSISYAAQVPPDDEGGFIYAVRGLLGGYKGNFTALNYYFKVQEYNNSESRDLWEYELSLSPDEIHRLLLHIWEIENNTWFDYYFFDENCSYHLLSTLQVARPDWELLSGRLYLTPAQSIRILGRKEGAIRDIRLRPSLRRMAYHHYNLLSAEQKRQMKTLVKGSLSESIPHQDIQSLEAGMAYLQYLKREHPRRFQQVNGSLRQSQILLQRSQMGLSPPLPAPQAENRPDWGHSDGRLNLGLGWNPWSHFVDMGVKLAYHDLLNDDRGYDPWSQIDAGEVILRYFRSRDFESRAGLRLERFMVANIVSFNPISPLERRVSWAFSLGLERQKGDACFDCLTPTLRSGIGAALTPSADSLIFFLAQGSMEVQAGLPRGYRLGPRVTAGALFRILPAWKISLQAGHQHSILPYWAKDYGFLEVASSMSVKQKWETRFGFRQLYQGPVDAERIDLQFNEFFFILNSYF